MTFIYVVVIFSHIFDHYPPHVCIRLHFKDPSLKRMSANWEFNPELRLVVSLKYYSPTISDGKTFVLVLCIVV